MNRSGHDIHAHTQTCCSSYYALYNARSNKVEPMLVHLQHCIINSVTHHENLKTFRLRTELKHQQR